MDTMAIIPISKETFVSLT